VAASLVVKADEEEMTSRAAKVVNGIATTGNWTFKWECDLLCPRMRDAHALDKGEDVQDVLLVRLGSKNNRRAPGAVAFVNPAVAEEDLNMLHYDFAFVGPMMGLFAADRSGTTLSIANSK
jgi:hypothetical protein